MRKHIPSFVVLLIGLGLVLGPSDARTASAQLANTAGLQELEEDLLGLQRQIDRLRRGDDVARVQAEIDTLHDELTYLRVKHRKEGVIETGEFNTLRNQIAELRSRLQDDTSVRTGARDNDNGGDSTWRDGGHHVIPVGTEIDVRLQTSLHSDTTVVEDPVRATTITDLSDGHVIIPGGSDVRGVVGAVDRSSRTDRTSSITLAFDELRIDDALYPVTLTVAEALESGGLRDEAERAGIGAGVGGLIGGILGGVRGALAGILIGAGGTVVATEGEDVDLPAGTILRLRFDAPLEIDDESARRR